MIYTHQIQTQGRTAIAARDVVKCTRRGGMGTFILALLLGVGALTGSSSLIAQEQKAAVATAVPKEQKSGATTAVTKVNINTADAQTLAANLKGVGDSRAKEIVRYREAYGPFASAEELTEVKGIGPSTLEMNRAVITLE